MDNQIFFLFLAVSFLLIILIAFFLWYRFQLSNTNNISITGFMDGLSRLEVNMRNEFSESMHINRSELIQSQEKLREILIRDNQNARIELGTIMSRFSSDLSEQLKGLIEINDRRMQEIRETLEKRLNALQIDNAARLDDMRRTVDEKLHITLEQRLGESFRLVSERLEAVHKGLGEMRNLAVGVGDLKRVLNNVKSRGVWGEVQLARLIEDNMTADQYGRNVKPIPGSDAIVEFAIRLPGRIDNDLPVWLPIDSKFPKEEYERLCDVFENADTESIKLSVASLARAVEVQARLIANKYISPPYTTDFAIMFLPTEGLYAEILRCPGLLDKLHNIRINVAGPSNFAALLNSLQMGFRTLTIERRSSEVWQILRAVKTEFGKFGESLASVKKTLETASSKLGQTEVRSRAMLKNLKTLEVLPDNYQNNDIQEKNSVKNEKSFDNVSER
ncbi:MAG: DNA recombination protein RmuC [Bordetella sp.]|nr:MAG: DNA recombination protein RmuC [Bordetella sp.]